jgi:glutathione reductase (NADPH)
MKKYDVFVIGTGVAGTTIAHKCAAAGLNVGISDHRPFGGACSLRGCVPKKVLIGAADVIDRATHLQEKGLQGLPKINWPGLMDFKMSFVQPVPFKKEKSFNESGIATFHGKTRFISQMRLKVGAHTIEADKIVIATGASPRELNINGQEHALTSDEFLDLKKLPESMVFVGGGYVAFEFAHLVARCGVKVTIVHEGASPLENFEAGIVKYLVEASKDLGIELVLNTEVSGIKKTNDGFMVMALQNGRLTEYTTGAVVNSSGRVPAIDDIDLEKADVRFSEKGIEVNQHLQSISNPIVYAAGDSSDKGLALTPVATLEAKVVASNIINGNFEIADYSTTPTVVYTIPPMASVGLTEQAAKEKNLVFATHYQHVPEWFNAKRLNEKYYAFKVLTEKSTGTILGAHLIGPGAAETINLFALAMRVGLKASDIQNIPFAFPSFASDIVHMF